MRTSVRRCHVCDRSPWDYPPRRLEIRPGKTFYLCDDCTEAIAAAYNAYEAENRPATRPQVVVTFGDFTP